MFNVPFFSDPIDDGGEIRVGDKVKVRYNGPNLYAGLVGICEDVDQYGGYMVSFSASHTCTFDRDMIRKINAKE